MGKSLVIVESPAKAKTIEKYLGKNFDVTASVGHVVDLPVKELGVDVENNFKPVYKILRGKEKIISRIKSMAEKADKIYLAPDPDREGEAIAWHIAKLIRRRNVPEEKIFRATFNEITKESVQKAIEEAGKLNENLFEAQQARRILDRLVGYLVSPLLWENVQKGLSAGRVQSVALRMICEREREIKDFVPQEYWSIDLDVRADSPPPFQMRLADIDGKKAEIKTGDDANAIVEAAKNERFVITKVTKRQTKRSPTPPFITSTMQQESIKKLRMSSRQTMQVAQKLYEGLEIGKSGSTGLITYMRTDSIRVSAQALTAVRDHIAEKYGEEYLPKTARTYRSKKGAQDAHEAIRPTNMKFTPAYLKKYLDDRQFKLYKLIWDKFVASQMAPAVLNLTRIECLIKDKYNFIATGSIVKFPGFQAVYMETPDEVSDEKEKDEKSDRDDKDKPKAKKDSEKILPDVKKGDVLSVDKIDPNQHFTQPPPQFTESSLVKELEHLGIGRPSTYATIVSVIQDKEYVLKEKGRFEPTELGFVINDLLVESFPDIFNVHFTAQMEEKLDKVEEGKVKWETLLKTFYKPFSKQLEKARSSMRNVRKETVETEIICEKCGRKMVIKWGRNGRFLACPGFPGCRNTKSLDGSNNSSPNQARGFETDDVCEKCGKNMVIRHGRKGRFLACPGYPQCTNSRPLTAGINCPMEDCDGKIVEKKTRKGKSFYACDNYPKCKYATWEPPIPKKCPECGHAYMILKRSGANEILKCPNSECEHIVKPG